MSLLGLVPYTDRDDPKMDKIDPKIVVDSITICIAESCHFRLQVTFACL